MLPQLDSPGYVEALLGCISTIELPFFSHRHQSSQDPILPVVDFYIFKPAGASDETTLRESFGGLSKSSARMQHEEIVRARG